MPSPTSRYFIPIKVFSVIVLILIASAILYAAMISIQNWTSINV